MPLSIYVTLGLRFVGGSFGEGGPSSFDAVDGGCTSGRLVNRALEEPLESFLLSFSSCAGIIGVLLLVGSGARWSVACSGTLATVSVRLRLANFDTGNGLEPEGRGELVLRKS